MNPIKPLIPLIIGTCLVAPVHGQVDSTLEELMKQDEFEQAGLDKLSEEELRFLNRWIREHDAMPAAAATTAASDERSAAEKVRDPSLGFRPESKKRTAITSQLIGDFDGWSGRTEFKLKNGQVWRQIDGRTFRHSAFEPEIEIRPKAAGSWRLYVEGINRSVKVVRIK